MRLISLSLIGYNVDEKEYGKHWNFFFTLFAVQFLASILKRVNRLIFGASVRVRLFSLAIAMLGGGLYQMALALGLSDFILSDDRSDSFADLNREGLASVVGSLFLYALAYSVIYTARAIEHKKMIPFLLLLSISIFLVAPFSVRPSRRLVYNIWAKCACPHVPR
jgi:hypothetical protein